MHDQPEDGAQHRARNGKPHGAEHAVQHRRALDHSPAGQELHRGGPLELRALQRLRALGGFEVRTCGFFAAPRPLEHDRQAPPQPALLFQRSRSRLERHPEQAFGLLERQLGDRYLRGPLGEKGCPGRVARSEQMPGDGLGVGARRRLERAGELRMMLAQPRQGQLGYDGLAKRVVAGLDDLHTVPQTGS